MYLHKSSILRQVSEFGNDQSWAFPFLVGPSCLKLGQVTLPASKYVYQGLK